MNRARAAWDRYWFSPVPVLRFERFSTAVYAVVLYTLVVDRWMANHGWAAAEFWKPTWLARTVGIPPPSNLSIALVQVAIVAGCVLGLTRRAPRIAGAVVGVSYTLWILWAFSWGKVDHDRLTIIVVLGVFAITALRGASAAARAGWGLRVVQVVFALAYPLSALEKLQAPGGPFVWVNSATFARAILRRGSLLGDFMLDPAWLLVAAQWAFLGFELFAVVLLFAKGRLLAVALAGVIGLHVVTYLMIGIHFLPHTICILAFFPLERLQLRLRRGRSAEPTPEPHLRQPRPVGTVTT